MSTGKLNAGVTLRQISIHSGGGVEILLVAWFTLQKPKMGTDLMSHWASMQTLSSSYLTSLLGSQTLQLTCVLESKVTILMEVSELKINCLSKVSTYRQQPVNEDL